MQQQEDYMKIEEPYDGPNKMNDISGSNSLAKISSERRPSIREQGRRNL